jgi:hypothetical protein
MRMMSRQLSTYLRLLIMSHSCVCTVSHLTVHNPRIHQHNQRAHNSCETRIPTSSKTRTQTLQGLFHKQSIFTDDPLSTTVLPGSVVQPISSHTIFSSTMTTWPRSFSHHAVLSLGIKSLNWQRLRNCARCKYTQTHVMRIL